MASDPDLISDAARAFLSHLPGADEKATKRLRSIDPSVAATTLIAASTEPDFGRSQIGKLVAALPQEVKADADQLRTWLEKWFDGLTTSMRATYRRRIRWWVGLFGLVVVFVTGIDSIRLADRLWDDPVQRSLLTAEAERLTAPPATVDETTSTTGDGTAPTTTVDAAAATTSTTFGCKVGGQATTSSTATPPDFGQDLKARLDCVREVAGTLDGLRVSAWQDGWNKAWRRPWHLVAGLLVTWAAVLFGAPFWFSALKRLMSLRPASSATQQTQS